MAGDEHGRAPSGVSSREERVARILAECSDRLNAGVPLDSQRILEENPDLAPDLKAALESLRDVESSMESERPLTTLGDFRILGELGRGGMGIIYEAWQISMDRRVALKVLPAALLANKKALARFEREAKVAGRLQHPNIVSVYGKGIEGGAPYYAMEFVEGETLEEILNRVRPPEDRDSAGWGLKPLESISKLFNPRETVQLAGSGQQRSEGKESRDRGLKSSFGSEEINLKYCLTVAEAFAEVAEGLQSAHQKGVIHRDLKPSNLMLDRKGRLRILDFGLARMEGQERLSVSGEFLGTPLYMSPEQAMAQRAHLDHRTDIYSLGATLYEVLTRRPPFRGKDYKETLTQIISKDPPPPRRLNPRIPRALEVMVLKCLSKDPADRYGTAEALGQDLRRFVRGDPIEARPQPVLEKVARRAWRRRWPILGVACAALLCLTTGVILHGHLREVSIRRANLYEKNVINAAVKIGLGHPIARSSREESQKARPDRPPRQGLLWEVAYAEVQDLAGWDPVEEALNELQRAIQEYPEKPDAHYHRARALLLKGRGDLALEELDRAIRCDGDFIPAIALRDAILEKPGDWEGILQRIQLGSAHWREAWRVAHVATLKKRWKAAAGAYTVLLRKEKEGEGAFLGSSIQTLLGRGRAFLRRALLEGRDSGGASHYFFSRAIEDFSAARWRWEDLIEPDLLLGKTYSLMGERERAEDLFRGLLRWANRREFRDGAPREQLVEEVVLRISRVYSSPEIREYKQSLDWAERIAASPARERRRASLRWPAGWEIGSFSIKP